MTLSRSGPQGGPARDLVQDTRCKSQDKRLVGLGYKGKLASWLRVQGKFQGSNTPKGQRLGEDYGKRAVSVLMLTGKRSSTLVVWGVGLRGGRAPSRGGITESARLAC